MFSKSKKYDFIAQKYATICLIGSHFLLIEQSSKMPEQLIVTP